MKTKIVEIKNLIKTYQQGTQAVDILKGLSLDIHAGQFTSIMGPSGSGKSTLLHLMGALDQASSGHILINGKDLQTMSDDDLSAFRRRKLGFIFQFFNLLPTLTALENVALPLLIDGVSLAQVKPKAEELLLFMGLSDRMNHRPDQLSGGQMQRVAIARALIADPVLILADEPTGNLDSESGTAVLDLLARLVREQGQTVVMVTHDPKAAAVGDRVIHIKDGRIDSDLLTGQVRGENTGSNFQFQNALFAGGVA